MPHEHEHEPMLADLMAMAHVRRLLLELGMDESPEQIVPAALGWSAWVSLNIAELAGRTPKELVADAEGSAALRRWMVAPLGLGS